MCQVFTLLTYLYFLAAVCECLRFRCTPKLHIILQSVCELMQPCCSLLVPQTQSPTHWAAEWTRELARVLNEVSRFLKWAYITNMRASLMSASCVVLCATSIDPVSTTGMVSHSPLLNISSMNSFNSLNDIMNSKCSAKTAHRQHLHGQYTTQCRLV